MDNEAVTPPEFAAAEHWNDLFHKQFNGESDRACVVLAGAMLDSALETLLRAYLVPIATADDPLFDGANSPLSTFSARIDIAHRVGLVDTGFARALHLVRRIRNDFAHNVSGCTFEDSSVVSRLTELRRALDFEYVDQEARASFPDGSRGDFQYIAGLLLWLLHCMVEAAEPITGPRWTASLKAEAQPEAAPA